MALTSAELTIGNQALVMIGQKIIDSSDTSTADTGTGGHVYEKLELVFDQTRDVLQRLFEWNFARARMALASEWETETAYTTDQYVWEDDELFKCNTAHTSISWNTDYVMDDDEYVLDDTEYMRDDTITFYWDLVTDRPETYWSYRYALPANFKRFRKKWLVANEYRFAIEQNYILTDEEEININYIKQVTDPSEFDVLYTEILIYDLAIKMTFALQGSGYVVIADRKTLTDERDKLLKRAKAINSDESDQGPRPSDKWNNARYGTGKV